MTVQKQCLGDTRESSMPAATKKKKDKDTAGLFMAPPGVQAILTHEVARYLNMSSGSVRTIALQGRLPSYKMGPLAHHPVAFNWPDVVAYKREMAKRLEEQRYMGVPPSGFKRDTPPSER